MRFSCCIPKATNRQSEHAIFITFPRQQWLRERASIRRYMQIVCLVTYKERNGNWFFDCRFYTNCTALRHTCHSNVFISCTETVIAQSLQLLGYVLCNRGPRVRFLLDMRLFYTMSRQVLGFTMPPTSLVLGLFPGENGRFVNLNHTSFFPELKNVWSHTSIPSCAFMV